MRHTAGALCCWPHALRCGVLCVLILAKQAMLAELSSSSAEPPKKQGSACLMRLQQGKDWPSSQRKLGLIVVQDHALKQLA